MARDKKKENLTLEERLQAALVPDWEQPYRVPENWCWVRVGSVCKLERGITFPASAKEKEPKSTNIPCLRTANVQDELEIDDLIYVNKAYMKDNMAKLIQEDDIIMSSANSRDLVGKTSYVYNVPFPMTFGGFVLTIRAKSIVSKYLFYFLRLEFLSGHLMGESAQTTNIANINTTKLSEYSLSLPPFAEQQRIVDRIESLFAKLDEAKQKAQDVLDSFETRKAAILHKAFTGALTARWRKEYSVGMESWKRKKYSEICNIVRGGSPRPAGSPEFYGGSIPFMKVADITRNKGPYVNSTEYTIKEAGLKKTRMVDAGTLLLTNSGATLGVPAICTFQTTFNDGIAAFLGLNSDTLLFHYYFWTSKTADLRTINKGVAQPNLNTDIIGNVEINLPTEREQTEIVRILDDLLAKEQQVKEAAEAVIEQIDLIKKSILARAFRGELGTNDPAEESSVELIRRILEKDNGLASKIQSKPADAAQTLCKAKS